LTQIYAPTWESYFVLEACLEGANGDAAFIAKALGDIARAKGMSQVARDAGLVFRMIQVKYTTGIIT
jgi:probable addiction module antidote protein